MSTYLVLEENMTSTELLWSGKNLETSEDIQPHLKMSEEVQAYMIYYAVKKVFVNFFAKFFEVFAKFFKVFASFLRFSRAFRGFRIHSDPLGCIRMHSEAIGSVWTFSKIFEIFWIFESFFNVSGRNFYKRLFSRHNILLDMMTL